MKKLSKLALRSIPITRGICPNVRSFQSHKVRRDGSRLVSATNLWSKLSKSALSRLRITRGKKLSVRVALGANDDNYGIKSELWSRLSACS